MEGISSFPKDFVPCEQDNKVIFYSGTLNYRFGIKNLLDAFDELNDDKCELWICGSGEAAEEIIERALFLLERHRDDLRHCPWKED